MRTMIDFDAAPVFAIAVTDGPSGPREGVLLEGPQGWGEFSPPADCDAREIGRWLTAATEPGTVGWPDAVRGRVPVAVTVPAVDARRAGEIVAGSGCRVADVTVAGQGASVAEDIARLEAVRGALGSHGAVRLRANGMWDVDTAVASIAVLSKAAGGVEYVEQPCRTLEELASVRRTVNVPIALRPSLLRTEAPLTTIVTDAADVAVLSCSPLGGVRRALRWAELHGLPCVVSSEWETSVGLAAGLALAGALEELPFACGLGTTSLLRGDVVAEARALVPVDGYLPVAPMPPAPDSGLLERHAVTDPARRAWWRERMRSQSR